jgi:hypothetical protein
MECYYINNNKGKYFINNNNVSYSNYHNFIIIITDVKY